MATTKSMIFAVSSEFVIFKGKTIDTNNLQLWPFTSYNWL